MSTEEKATSESDFKKDPRRQNDQDACHSRRTASISDSEDVLECQPISTFDQLLEWESGTISGIRAESLTVPLKKHHKIGSDQLGQVVVCHDMKGGYLEDDRFCADSKNENAYRFYHWSLIDAFIYFSHHLVTIPPVSWVNAAHVNGVPILGTFIVENAQLAEKLFASPERVLEIVGKLVDLSRERLLQGYLLNIETAISSENMENLLLFASTLTTEMHREIPDSQVIWYDSVTREGKLKWQNELNEENMQFFQVTDAIFLNYNWSQITLQNSIQFADSVGRPAKDIQVGIDVFGRGCFGGGGWNTKAAVEEIKKVSKHLSIAIFAPGWVLECNDEKNFEMNQSKFWNDLDLPERHCPAATPIETSFCQGFGKKMYRFGSVEKEGPWFNLSRQSLQPGRRFISQKMFIEDAFCGGSCLRLADFSEPVIKCHLDIPFAGLLVSLTFKPLVPNSPSLTPPPTPSSVAVTFTSKTLKLLPSQLINPSKSNKIDRIFKDLEIPTSTINGWMTETFLVSRATGNDDDDNILCAVWVAISDAHGRKEELLIGHLKILEATSNIATILK